jgi:hypothetical protein
LYVPEVRGIMLHFGLLDRKHVGLITEIGDYQFEIRLFPGAWDTGSWNAGYFDQARAE